MGPDVWPTFSLDWTILGLDLGLLYARVMACVVWHVMAICVDCFVGISYATIGCEN